MRNQYHCQTSSLNLPLLEDAKNRPSLSWLAFFHLQSISVGLPKVVCLNFGNR
ncbi:hypothetical protein TYRP_021498 [Tyrophagus putrescentiae]|nr:hypothetical protein TYRP_021498 [Tyrophagus putrescentiae]